MALLLISQVTGDELFNSLVFGEAGGPVKPGYSYVFKEKKPQKTFIHFWEMMNKGYRGLLITRQHPDHVEKKFGPGDLKVVWLSTTLGKDYVDPHNLGSLTNLVNRFVEDGSKTVILLDGLEYLMVNNDFSRILKFIEYVNEIVMQKKSLLLISIDPKAFEERDLALLERNVKVI
ncbi:MAG: DUF835 domain-containing protein [Methanobacteriota archaeon]|nr:MAG: DUF835 domain-containing protein [Euryarchaeota archaeon]